MAETAEGRQITAPRAHGARLVIYPPQAPARVLFVVRGNLDVGRDGTNGIQLDDSRVSGQHARIRRRRDSGRFEVVDQDSRNGTYVDGRRVRVGLLEDGSVVRVGDALILVELGPEPDTDSPTSSLASIALERRVEQAASARTSCLLLGPHGSGKSFLAQRIADLSRRDGPFVTVNCAAIPADLAESELFGHVRGAFTGAVTDKVGLVRAADGGSLFLDEIGATSPTFQAKLLTCIEDGSVRPVGATRSQPVDVRYVAATNLDVDEAIASGVLREDLYARLAGTVVAVPPLARRRAEIVPLLRRRANLGDHRSFTAEALEALLIWPWRGNIRELLHLAEGLSDLPSRPLDYHALPAEMTAFIKERLEPSTSGDMPSRAVLAAELEAVGGNVSELARRLGKHRNQVVRWLKAQGLRPGKALKKRP